MNQFSNESGTISSEHLHELEGVLGALLTNQEIIIEQNKELLSAKKKDRIWKIIKMLLFVLVLVVPMFFLPQIMESMMGQINGIMGEQINNMATQQLDIDPSKLSEIEQLLGR